MFDRLTLAQDLIDCRGQVLASQGFVVSPESIAEAAMRAAPVSRKRLADALPWRDLLYPFGHSGCRHLFHGQAVRTSVEAALLAIHLPEVLWEELAAMRELFPHLWCHALVAAATAARMLLAALGPARGVPDLAAAALVHDLGMLHLPPHILRNRDRLTRDEATAVAAHPLLGAYHLARVLGAHPAVSAARSHHWRCGQGYPGLSAPPSRSIEVVSVASAYAALVEPRPFRSDAYDARGATDVLVAEAAAGYADPSSVRLLVHALRGGRGEIHTICFGHERSGHAPEVNRHTPVTAPDRSPV